MKFICQSCKREFDIGAPKGMQLPCPACGGMLVDEESSTASAAPAGPAPAPAPAAAPAPSPAAFGAPADDAEGEEFSLDAAERFAAQGTSGGDVLAGAAEPAPPPPQPVQPVQPAQPVQPPPQAAPPPQQWQEQPQPEAAPQPEAYQYAEQEPGAEQYGAPEGMDPAAVYEDQAYPPEAYAEQGYDPEAMGEFPQEAAASPVVLMLGWVLFGIALVGIMVMGYFLKEYKAKGGAGSADDRARILELEKELADQATNVVSYKKERDDAMGKSDGLSVQVKELKDKLVEYETKGRGAVAASKHLRTEYENTSKELKEASEERDRLRKRAEKWEFEATRSSARTKAAAQTLHAAELLEKPAQWGEALGFLDAATRADEELDAAWLLKGQILARLGRAGQAVEAFDRVDRIARKAGAKGHARALVAAGDVCRTQIKDERRATALYRRALEAAPGSPYGLLGEARAVMLDSGPEAALKKVVKSIKAVEEAKADATQLKLLRAEVLAGDEATREEALEAVSSVVAANPALVEALDLRAKLLVESERPEVAVGDLARAAELDPTNGERLVELGKVYLGFKRPEAAEPVLRRATELMEGPKAKQALISLGRALVDLGRYDDAEKPLAKIFDLDADNVEARRLRGEARVSRGDFGPGIHDLEESLELGRDDPHTRMVLSQVYATAMASRFRIPRKAIEHGQAAVDLTNGESAEALATLAKAYEATGDFARAAIEMRKGVRLEPENEGYRVLLRAYEDRSR